MIHYLMQAAIYCERTARENLVRLEIQSDGVKVYGLRVIEGEKLPRAANRLVPWISINSTSFNPLIDALDEVYKELEKCEPSPSSSSPSDCSSAGASPAPG